MKIYKQVMILALGGITQNAHGLVFLNSGDPNYNTTAPSGAMANPWKSSLYILEKMTGRALA